MFGTTISGARDQRMCAQNIFLQRCLSLSKPNLELRMLFLLKDNAPAVDTKTAIELIVVCPPFLLAPTSLCSKWRLERRKKYPCMYSLLVPSPFPM